MSVKVVDCVILAMLREERKLFLKNNNCLFYDRSMMNEEFLEFKFFDKDNRLRKGVIASLNREMGNTEAGRLMYKLSRKYHSELFINIGVVGYISEVNVGDVIIVNDCYSLCEKNVANSKPQKTDAKLDTTFIEQAVDAPLEREYASVFRKESEDKLQDLRKRLENYISRNELSDNLKTSLRDTCKHEENVIKLGSCATYHSVVKDEETRDQIKAVRKTNIVDMEAFYFHYWHRLIKAEEYDDSLTNSKMLFFKSISDTAIEEEKDILEKLGTRQLAMSNIYKAVTYYICEIHQYMSESKMDLATYFDEKISNIHVDRLISYAPEAEQALEKLCSYLIVNDKINGISIDGNYIRTVCDILKKDNQILVLEGNPGKGKSTFISYVYKKVAEEQPAVFISIPEILTSETYMSSEQGLYLLKRLLKHNRSITVFVDGVEGSRQKKAQENRKMLDDLIMILNQYRGRNVSLCIGAWHTNDVNDIKREILDKINTESEVNTLTFQSVSAFDDGIDDFISKFADFYTYYDSEFDRNAYVNKVKDIVKNGELQLRYVDFRLLYLFAKKRQALKSSNNIFDFIQTYCASRANVQLDIVIDNVAAVLERRNIADNSGLLTKNIYSRAFLFSKFIYNAYIHNEERNIQSILTNKYILSDNINLFLEYMLKANVPEANEFFEHVLESLQNNDECQICSKTQLLYNISKVTTIRGKKKQTLKDYIIAEIQKLDSPDLLEQESDVIISYRTLAIILNNRFGESKYLQRFNAMLTDSNESGSVEMIKRINRNFHLLYYSQIEFTYDKVEDNVLFELEVIGNAYRILKSDIISEALNLAYRETCAITLLQLIEYIEDNDIQVDGILGKEELVECAELIKSVQNRYNLQYVKKLIKSKEF